MSSFVFVHTADCHLDAPFVGVGREDPALASRLRDTQRDVFDDLINLCIDRDAAFLVIAGDLYDAAERSLTTRVRLREAFRRLEGQGIQVFFATGNHDNLDETQRGLDFPPNVRIFSADQPETFLWPEEQPIVSVTGISYGRRAIDENLAGRFPKPPDAPFNVAVLHCNVEGDAGHDNYAPCRLDDLLRSGYDYWALGHVHERRVLAESPGAAVVYPGCLQGRQIRETGEKGATVVSVNESGEARIESAPLERVRWIQAEVDAGDVESDEQLAELLGQHANDLAAKAPSRVQALVIRWRLVGQLACDTAAVRRVLETLQEAASEGRTFIWSESIDVSRAATPFVPAELADEQTQRGDLVREVERLRAGATEELESLRSHLIEQVGPPELAEELRQTRAALREREPAIEEILDEALRLGMDLLSRPRE